MNRYTAAAVASGMLVGFAGSFARILGQGGMSSQEISMTRAGIAAVAFLAAAVKENWRILKIDPRDFWMFLGSGVLGQFCFALFYFQAVTVIPLAVTSTLSLTYPFFVLILSRLLFREKLTAAKITAMIVALLGCSLVSGALGGPAGPALGILLALASGFSYALYSIFSRLELGRGYSPKTVNFYSWLIAFACSLAAWPEQRPFAAMTSCWQNLVICLAMGLLIGYGANYLFSYSLTGLEAGKASILTSSSPVFAAAVGAVFFRESVSLRQALGVLCILTAAALLQERSSGAGRARRKLLCRGAGGHGGKT